MRDTMEPMSFFARLRLALTLLFAPKQARIAWAPALPPAPGPQPAETVVERVVEKVVETDDSALLLMSVLQRDGRLIDFLQEDIRTYSDADIGASVRQVHASCKKIVDDAFAFAPIRAEAEGARVTLPVGFDAAQNRLSGRVNGDGPHQGTLAHAGWRATKVVLPTRTGSIDPRIVAPAEIEVAA
jgi:Domain of unknown function (DUF2760)